MKNLFFLLIVIGLMPIVHSQIIELSEVEVFASKYRYLDAVGAREAAVPVKMLEEKVAEFDLKKSDLYDDEYDTYTVSFFIPDGKIVAAYNNDGTIIRTIEKFDNIRLPDKVRDAIFKRFPNWDMVKNAYSVTYHNEKGVGKKVYKAKLINGNETVRVKLDDEGNFL